jgi:hypothetical protein
LSVELNAWLWTIPGAGQNIAGIEALVQSAVSSRHGPVAVAGSTLLFKGIPAADVAALAPAVKILSEGRHHVPGGRSR